jgi:membrane protein
MINNSLRKNEGENIGQKLTVDQARSRSRFRSELASRQPSPEQREEHSPGKLGGLSVGELAKRVWKAVESDDVFGRSAQLAYYFFLALFPALICLTALLGIFAASSTELRQGLMNYIATALPPSAYDLVSKTLEQTTRASGGGKIGFGLIASLWSATAGMNALEDTLNAVYNVKESRPLWKTYAIAIGLTVVCSLLVFAALVVILYGNGLSTFAANQLGLGPVASWTWKIVQWVFALLFLALVFSLTYYFCPDVDQRHWQWITPGAIVGMTTWIIASAILRIYLHFFDSYTATYGSLGAVMILLLWFYVTGMMLLLGAEVNAEIENAAAERGLPDAKEKGQKTPAVPESRTA